MRKQKHFSYGLSRHNFLKWGLIAEPNAFGGPWPGEERHTGGKQSPAARAGLSNCHSQYNTVQCSVLPQVHWAVAANPKCTTIVSLKIHHLTIFKTIKRSYSKKKIVYVDLMCFPQRCYLFNLVTYISHILKAGYTGGEFSWLINKCMVVQQTSMTTCYY